MKYRVKRTDDINSVEALHTLCFPNDDWEDSTQHWIVWDETDTPVGFCSARLLSTEPGVFLSRSGLLPCARGAGLQRRMITTRLRWAKTQGVEFALTYTVYDNHASAANLLRQGFRFHDPEYAWAGRDVFYFLKTL